MKISKAKDSATLKFGIIFPLTFDSFMKKRADIIKENHEDKGSSCSTEKFTEILDILNTVRDNFEVINGFQENQVSMTRTGDLLSNLGKGLGSLQNGSTCESCNGKGYTVEKVPVYEKGGCDCEYGWLYIYETDCKYCRGTGTFHTRSGYDVKCKACYGTGKHVFQNPRLVNCPKCNPHKRNSLHFYLFGHEQIIGYKSEYHTCYNCNGIGEIKIHNPVFQKGAMQSNNSKGKSIKNTNNLQKRFNKLMKTKR